MTAWNVSNQTKGPFQNSIPTESPRIALPPRGRLQSRRIEVHPPVLNTSQSERRRYGCLLKPLVASAWHMTDPVGARCLLHHTSPLLRGVPDAVHGPLFEAVHLQHIIQNLLHPVFILHHRGDAMGLSPHKREGAQLEAGRGLLLRVALDLPLRYADIPPQG